MFKPQFRCLTERSVTTPGSNGHETDRPLLQQMKILVVTNVYPSPDAPWEGTYVEQQVKGLRRIGLDADVLFADRQQEGVGVYRSLGKRLREHIDRTRPTVVHAMYGGRMAEVVTRVVRDRPVVVSFCGSDLLGDVLAGRLRKLVGGLGVLASQRAARRAAGIIVKATNLRDALPASVPRQKIRLIPNGVDQERFRPMDRDECRASLGWEKGGFHVLFPSSSANPRKRLWLARAAVEEIDARGVRAQLHQLSDVPHALVPVWLNASDAVVLTSRHEGSANIIKEALACDVPVVSVDVGDARERLQGLAGCHIAEPLPEDIAAKLLLVHAGPGRVDGRAAMTELTLERVALRIKDFYEDVLALPTGETLFRDPGRRQSSVEAVEPSESF